jgi:hypothetical protein
MKIRRKLGTLLLLMVLVGGVQTIVSAQTVHARHNRIVGLWDVQVTVLNCSTGAQIATFPALHKYELGGTAQVVPGGNNPTGLSAHMGIWQPVRKNQYQLTFKMFRFDGAGTNIGWVVAENDIAISEDATAYAGSGRAEFFDSNGNSQGASCPTFTGTRFK